MMKVYCTCATLISWFASDEELATGDGGFGTTTLPLWHHQDVTNRIVWLIPTACYRSIILITLCCQLTDKVFEYFSSIQEFQEITKLFQEITKLLLVNFDDASVIKDSLSFLKFTKSLKATDKAFCHPKTMFMKKNSDTCVLSRKGFEIDPKESVFLITFAKSQLLEFTNTRCDKAAEIISNSCNADLIIQSWEVLHPTHHVYGMNNCCIVYLTHMP